MRISNPKKFTKFTLAFLFTEWGWFAWVANGCTIIALLLAHLFDSNWKFAYSASIVALIFVACFILHCAKMAYRFFESFREPLKVIRRVNGEGAYEGAS